MDDWKTWLSLDDLGPPNHHDQELRSPALEPHPVGGAGPQQAPLSFSVRPSSRRQQETTSLSAPQPSHGGPLQALQHDLFLSLKPPNQQQQEPPSLPSIETSLTLSEQSDHTSRRSIRIVKFNSQNLQHQELPSPLAPEQACASPQRLSTQPHSTLQQQVPMHTHTHTALIQLPQQQMDEKKTWLSLSDLGPPKHQHQEPQQQARPHPQGSLIQLPQQQMGEKKTWLSLNDLGPPDHQHQEPQQLVQPHIPTALPGRQQQQVQPQHHLGLGTQQQVQPQPPPAMHNSVFEKQMTRSDLQRFEIPTSMIQRIRQIAANASRLSLHDAHGTISVSLANRQIHGLDRVGIGKGWHLYVKSRHPRSGDGIRFSIRPDAIVIEGHVTVEADVTLIQNNQ